MLRAADSQQDVWNQCHEARHEIQAWSLRQRNRQMETRPVWQLSWQIEGAHTIRRDFQGEYDEVEVDQQWRAIQLLLAHGYVPPRLEREHGYCRVTETGIWNYYAKPSPTNRGA